MCWEPRGITLFNLFVHVALNTSEFSLVLSFEIRDVEKIVPKVMLVLNMALESSFNTRGFIDGFSIMPANEANVGDISVEFFFFVSQLSECVNNDT